MPNFFRLALWLVSNCETFSAREDFVDELVKFVDVDVFGKCSGASLDNPINVGWGKTFKLISKLDIVFPILRTLLLV